MRQATATSLEVVDDMETEARIRLDKGDVIAYLVEHEIGLLKAELRSSGGMNLLPAPKKDTKKKGRTQ